MPRKRPKSIDGYKNLGLRLAILRDLITDVAVKIGHNFPKTYYRRVEASIETIDKIRIDLEKLMVEQFPDEWDANIFYPNTEDRNVNTLLDELTFHLEYKKKK